MALGVVLATGAAGCAGDFDTSRHVPQRGTVGEELYTVLCSRVGAQALPEDLTGESFHSVCEKNAQGVYGDTVDAKRLPTMVDGALNKAGIAVPAAAQEQSRRAAVARIEALARRRGDLIAAFDATMPTVKVPLKDLGNADPAKSCEAPAAGGEGELTGEIADLLGRMTDLYNDGTVPASTRSLAALMDALKSSPEAQNALAQFDARQGYRPLELALGVVRPLVAYPRLRDLANATLRLLSADSDPYALDPPRDARGARKPEPGPAYAHFKSLLVVAREELRAAKPEATVLPPLRATPEPLTGGTVLSRPRTMLEIAREVLYAEDPAFGGGGSRYIAKRDPRGLVAVPLANGLVPAPFVDSDGDKLPDVTTLGAFVTTAPAPPPFFAIGQPLGARDPVGRALRNAGDPALLYDYLDTSHTFTAQLLRDLRPLVNPDPAARHETLMYALGGLRALAGPRAQVRPSRCFTRGAEAQCAQAADKVVLTYDGFDTAASPLVDLAYATGQILADRSSADMLALVQKLVTENTQDLARVTGAALGVKAIADKHPEAKLKEGSLFWDEMLDVLTSFAQEPGLLEGVMTALAQEDSAELGRIFGNYLLLRDQVTYDRANLNGPAFNVTRNGPVEMGTPVDRSKPDTGFNRSAMQRLLALIHDTNGVTTCNKAAAKVHARGVPLLGSAIIPSLEDKGAFVRGPIKLAAWRGKETFAECEIFKIDNLATFYLDGIVGKATMYLRDRPLREGVLGLVGAATTGMMEQSSGITGFFGEGRDLRPTPQWLNRFVFFDQAGDAHDPTQTFLRELNGQYIGTSVCSERVIDDPKPDADDAAPDGKVRGLRQCADGDNLQQRDKDTLFVWENFGYYRAIAPLLNVFVERKKEALFLDFMEVLHRHWASEKTTAAECLLSRDPAAKHKECGKTNLVAYEPILAEAFAGDLVPAIQSLLKKLETVTVTHCDAADAGGTCTQAHDVSGVSVLAEATRTMLDPARAKAAALVDRRGGVTAKRNDGTVNPQVTPMYLLADALSGVDAALAADPDKTRAEQWKLGRSQLVDQFLAVAGAKDKATFANAAVPRIAPRLIEVLRAQLAAHCASSAAPPGGPAGAAAPCAWAKTELTRSLESTVGGPAFAAALDVADAIRKDDAARVELERLLQYLLDAPSSNDALAALLASASDVVQVLQDDANLVPLFHAVAGAADTLDAHLALLARLSGRAFDRSGKEICARELDPNQVLTVALGNLVTPMGAGKQAPLQVIMDVIADVNRSDPSMRTKLDAGDYGSIAAQVSSFLSDKERGLEQFYEIVRRGTRP